MLVSATAAAGSLGDAWAQTSRAERTYRHPHFVEAVRAVRNMRWRELSDIVTAQPSEGGLVLVNDIADGMQIGASFGELELQPMGHTIIAAAHVSWAWRFRGTGVGSTVTPESYRMFAQHLTFASEHVARAIAADANDGAAFAIGFRAHMGLSDIAGVYGGLRGYLLASRRPVSGLGAFANAVSRKWLGTEEQALTFARQTAQIDLPASSGIVPYAHHVCWGARAIAAMHTSEPEPFAQYVTRDEVRADILSANEAFASVAPDPDPFANWYANASFSFALFSMNEINLARPHLSAMGEYVGGPWSDMDHPQETLDGVRRQLGMLSL